MPLTARTALLAALAFAAVPAFAQDDTATDGATTDSTSTDSTSTDSTSTDSMSTDAASGDAASGDAAGALPPELADASQAIEAASAAGLLETLTSGEPFTAFIPTNEALSAVASSEEATAAMADQAAFANLISAYVVEGNVMAADAMQMVTDEGGTHIATSLAGTPIELAMEGDALTVNGQPVTTPDLMIGNVTVHLLGGAFLPEAASGDAAATESSGG